MNGLKFKRQQPIGDYIVDFVCFERKTIIELDGGQHAQPDQMKRDKERDRWLNRQGYEVLRFWDNEVLKNIRAALEVIGKRCLKHPPLKGGEVMFSGFHRDARRTQIKALVAISRKLLSVIFALVRNHSVYTENYSKIKYQLKEAA